MPHLGFWLSAACIALAWVIWAAARLIRRDRQRRAAGARLGRRTAAAHMRHI